jgi:hypothetical protein
MKMHGRQSYKWVIIYSENEKFHFNYFLLTVETKKTDQPFPLSLQESSG